MNAANEKLCMGDWLKEYVTVLERDNKLDETISKLVSHVDPEAIGDNEAKKTLITSLYKDKDHQDDVNNLYFDYLCDKDSYHLI